MLPKAHFQLASLVFIGILSLPACGDKDDETTADDTGDDDDGGGTEDDDDDDLPIDTDNDGWGDEIDCDPDNADVNPGEDELCNGVDDDCDGDIDEEPVDGETVYVDGDGDGYGDDDQSTMGCPGDSGVAPEGGDCDDTDDTINPAATEQCDDVDHNCDGDTEEGSAEASTWYPDEDSDGYGDDNNSAEACEQPDGWVSTPGDCDDDDAFANPSRTEICNDKDDNCDGEVDEDSAFGADTWYEDGDEDTYGDPDSTTTACDQPSGYVANSSDCDDANDENNPDAMEDCDDTDDNDCDGTANEYCYESYEGTQVFLFDNYGGAAEYYCRYQWDVSGERADRCPECDFAFDASLKLAESEDDDEICSLSETFKYTFGFAEDYAGYGPYMVLEYYGYWYGVTDDSSWDALDQTFEYTTGYEDLYLGYGAYETYSTYGYGYLYY